MCLLITGIELKKTPTQYTIILLPLFSKIKWKKGIQKGISQR